MERKVKSLNQFINEYWVTDAPGTVVVPGQWYKDGVNSRNYKPNNTTMPHVVDPMLEDSEFDEMLEDMKKDIELVDKIKGSEDPLEIIELIKQTIKSKRSK